MSATTEKGPTAGEPAPAFQQRLGLFDATMLVAGTMIGSGIFVVSAYMARDVGSAGWLLVAWLVTGLMTIIGALSYAELAAMMPTAGGQYVYLREAYSPLWGFLYGWAVFLIIQTGSTAAVAVVFAAYLGELAPAFGTENILYHASGFHWKLAIRPPWMEEPLVFFERTEFKVSVGHLVAVGVIAFLTLLNCRGVQEGKWVQNVFTLAKLAALGLLIVLGLTVAASAGVIEANSRDAWSGITGTPTFLKVEKIVPGWPVVAIFLVVAATTVYSLFAADAWNNVTFTAGEVRNPRRNLPLSLLLGSGLVILLYLLANAAYLASLPIEAIAGARENRVGTAVMQLVSPRLGVPFMAVAIMISTFGCVNGMILMGARLYYAMARDRLFFQSVGRLNRQGVPAAGLIVQGLWSIVLVFSGSYDELTEYAIFAALIFYVLTVVGLFVLRRKQPDAVRPYRAFGYPLVPALYVLLCLAVMIALLLVKPAYSWAGLFIVLTGIPVYFLWRHGWSHLASSERERGG